MAITALEQWSTTAASNVDLNSIPIDGAVTTPSQVDNLFRELMAQVAVQIGEMNFEGADIASAATTNLANATGWSLDITGTTTITALGTVNAGHLFILRFTDALTLTHNATSLILPGAANITTAAGDVAWMKSEGSGNWRCVNYMRAASLPTTGPASSTDNAAARFNGTVGVIQNSGVIIDDSDNVTGVTSLNIDGPAGLVLSDATAGIIAQSATNRQIQIRAGSTAVNGATLYMYGESHATQASDYQFTVGAGLTRYQWDNSVGNHDWYNGVNGLVARLSTSQLAVFGTIASTGSISSDAGLTGTTGTFSGLVSGFNYTSATGGFHTAGKTASNPATVGACIISSGQVNGTVSADTCQILNRIGAEGTIVQFRGDNVTEGTIAESGGTVTYNAFLGSHWSQLLDGSKPDILRGTVCETLDELCEWPEESNDRLPKFKVSDTLGSASVYGVFLGWDNDDERTNDAYIASIGAGWVRIAPGAVVQKGDLLESDGTGCALVQADGIFRTNTIAKVTSGTVIETYPDGSYLVPCTLHCG